MASHIVAAQVKSYLLIFGKSNYCFSRQVLLLFFRTSPVISFYKSYCYFFRAILIVSLPGKSNCSGQVMLLLIGKPVVSFYKSYCYFFMPSPIVSFPGKSNCSGQVML